MNRGGNNRPKVDELFGAFDLGFSDAFAEDSVRQQTFRSKLDALIDARKVIDGDSIVNYALFVELGDDHPTPRLWLECETDLRGSIYLTLGGYYRQALICLRTWLELTLPKTNVWATFADPICRVWASTEFLLQTQCYRGSAASGSVISGS